MDEFTGRVHGIALRTRVQYSAPMPEFDSTTRHLARTLRRLRAERGLSLEGAAERAGISRRLLVGLEGGTGNPSLGTLLRLAEGLGVGLADLLEPDERSVIQVRNDDEARTLWSSDAGSSARLLIASPDLELWAWELAPGDVRASDPHRAGTQEIVHLARGRMVIVVDDHHEEVIGGQVARFAGDRPHRFENPGPDPAAFTLVVHEPVR